MMPPAVPISLLGHPSSGQEILLDKHSLNLTQWANKQQLATDPIYSIYILQAHHFAPEQKVRFEDQRF